MLLLLASICLDSSGKQAQRHAQKLSETSALVCCHLSRPMEQFFAAGE